MNARPEVGLLASGHPFRTFPERGAFQWLPHGLRRRIARSQWRVRAGLSPASLGHRPLSRSAYPPGTLVGVTVNLTRIYTRLGDDGETHLGDMSRVAKTHPRIEAYGDVDELNSQLGVTLTIAGLPEAYADWLRRVQNDLFDVGADLSVPESKDAERERLRVRAGQVEWLEARCDEVNATLEPLRSFVLPGGTPAAAHLHVCRTVCRRAERRALAWRARTRRSSAT